MSILTAVWSTAAAMCFSLALLHFYIGLRKQRAISHLLFTVTALAAGFSAFMELWTLLADNVASYVLATKYLTASVGILIISITWFVVVYFKTAKVWLAWIITALWCISLFENFLSPFGYAFQSISELKYIALPWGEQFAVAIGATNPWKFLGADLASLLFVIFVADASIRLWRKKDREDRRHALSIGGSIVFFILVAGIHAPLVDEGIIKTPYLISFAYLAIIFATGFELSSDVIKTSILTKEVRANERRWRSLLEQVQLIVAGLNTEGNIEYVNPFLLKLTGFRKQEVLGKHFSEFIPSRQVEGVHSVFRNLLEANPYSQYQNAIITREGEERLIDWSNVTLFDREEEIIGTIAIGADVTDREEAFQEIEQLKNQLQDENIYLQEEIILDHNHRDIIGQSDALKYALSRVDQVAPTDTTVLIEGETGAGKELFARAVHHASPRKNHPLVKVNCAAIQANLIESELFGHIKGAFTGADKDRKGRFELADKGTLFLDEIGELPLELQPKLLRVLEDGEFERLGSNDTKKVDVRVIAATNRNLKEEVQKGRFREDLYYRLEAYPISIPPLRKRKDDILPLVESLVDKFSRKLGKRIEKIPTQAREMLLDYDWPGNVRELRNVIERAVIATPGEKLILPEMLQSAEPEEFGEEQTEIISLEEAERRHIIKALEATGGKISGENGAAVLLKIHPNTLRFRMQKLNIDRVVQ